MKLFMNTDFALLRTELIQMSKKQHTLTEQI